MPPSSTAPLRDPASSRTAECPSRCHGEASWARASIARDDANKVAAKPSAARMGTITIMRRLYSQGRLQTIELLVIWILEAARSLIDRTGTQYQDVINRESFGWTLKAKHQGLLAA